MSYPLYLDDISDYELTKEIERRAIHREANTCDYCLGVLGSKPSCLQKDRHNWKKT
jgi:hypothetical protein